VKIYSPEVCSKKNPSCSKGVFLLFKGGTVSK